MTYIISVVWEKGSFNHEKNCSIVNGYVHDACAGRLR